MIIFPFFTIVKHRVPQAVNIPRMIKRDQLSPSKVRRVGNSRSAARFHNGGLKKLANINPYNKSFCSELIIGYLFERGGVAEIGDGISLMVPVE